MIARPVSAIKRNKALAPKVQAQRQVSLQLEMLSIQWIDLTFDWFLWQQEELRLPDAAHFLKKRDFVAALTLLECEREARRLRWLFYLCYVLPVVLPRSNYFLIGDDLQNVSQF